MQKIKKQNSNAKSRYEKSGLKEREKHNLPEVSIYLNENTAEFSIYLRPQAGRRLEKLRKRKMEENAGLQTFYCLFL